ncbi:ATP-dependent RNA helicase DeaD [Halopseudomonas oceani]|uniref:DEAD-box ATP-dependent RNA helicase RhpA n=1 Tax=Halopseudomonas oceani TaxID=1708783 RepID=A0A2P4EUJ3_9GAMM|nr:DEAD/DEAH box helicase [Halopseudomonas oceani]POB03131.1 ATP-dependent RNA helicase [Halopseudomonas oceani]GGE48952.1 ATP-dependent RNA helicase DeaD [Halopseudomonas oceani]
MSDTAPARQFADLGLPAHLLEALNSLGYETPSPIQAEAIPTLLAGKDLLGLAQTGTGKTAAFALPVLAGIDVSLRATQALILTPTRELALQVAEAFQRYAQNMRGFTVLALYGGSAFAPQFKALERGAHVVVATPGRLTDHLRRGSLKLQDLRYLALDEADEMLKMGFADDLEAVFEEVPDTTQKALFSATMPPGVRNVARNHMKEPAEIRLHSGASSSLETITQKVWEVSNHHKLDAMTRLLEVEPVEAMIVFVRTKTASLELAERLEARGFAAAALNGDLTQQLREQVVDRLKRGLLDIVVATDVAARGLDVERITHVLNYDLPHDSESYVHRIGRTGRAGRQGTAILFATPRERRLLHVLERATGQKIEPQALPTADAVRSGRLNKLASRLNDAREQATSLHQQLVSDLQELTSLDATELAAALLTLLPSAKTLLEPVADLPSAPPRREREFDRDSGLTRYKVQGGRKTGLMPKPLVDVLVKVGGLQRQQIGHIKLFNEHTGVFLPTLDQAVINRLAGAEINGVTLQIKAWPLPEGELPPRDRAPRGKPPRREYAGKPKGPRKA